MTGRLAQSARIGLCYVFMFVALVVAPITAGAAPYAAS